MKGSILLTGNEIKILRALKSPKEAQDIASATGINRTGIYKMLHRLEKKGFIFCLVISKICRFLEESFKIANVHGTHNAFV